MEYTICVGIELDSTATQTRYSIAKHHFFSVLQWYIWFVWVLSRTQQPHKHDIPFQNTIFLAFYNGIYVLCGYWLDSTLTQTKHDIPFQKTVLLAFYNGIYDLCGYWVEINSHTNTIFHRKTSFFSVLLWNIRYVLVSSRINCHTNWEALKLESNGG